MSHGDPGLPDLRFEFGHFGLGEGIGVLGVLEAFLGGRVALLELHLTVILGFGDFQGHLFGGKLRFIGLEPGLVRLKLVELRHGIDFGDQIAFLHVLPEDDMQLFDLPADLCAHADELDRADFAGGVDGSGNVSDRHGFRQIGHPVALIHAEHIPRGDRCGDGKRRDEEQFFFHQSIHCTAFPKGKACFVARRNRCDERFFEAQGERTSSPCPLWAEAAFSSTAAFPETLGPRPSGVRRAAGPFH